MKLAQESGQVLDYLKGYAHAFLGAFLCKYWDRAAGQGKAVPNPPGLRSTLNQFHIGRADPLKSTFKAVTWDVFLIGSPQPILNWLGASQMNLDILNQVN